MKQVVAAVALTSALVSTLVLGPGLARAEDNVSVPDLDDVSAPVLNVHGETAREQAARELQDAGPGAKIRTYFEVPGQDPLVPHQFNNLLYLNNCTAGHNCTFHSGNDNSVTNASSIVDGTSQVSAFQFGQSSWDQTEACFREVFAPFGITITTTDPGNTPHMELVVAGEPQDIGLQDGILGIAIFPGDCGVYDQPIAFDFANAHSFYSSDPRRANEICATGAQEIAHTWSLDHSSIASDPMTYKDFSSRRHFQDDAEPCGSDCNGAGGLNCTRNCQCPGADGNRAVQNSVEDITDIFGNGTLTPPTVTITSPANGASVAPGFPVHADITDDMTVAKGELRVDGVLVATQTGLPWAFNAPSSLGQGNHIVQVTGYDILGASASKQITVTIGEPCEIPGDCEGNQTCVGGRCVAAPGTPGGLGEDCTEGTQCNSGLCGDNGAGERHCIEVCDLDNDQCPSGFGCVKFGDQGACWPGADGGGGCQSSDDSTAALGLSLGFAGLVLGVRRRRGARTAR